MKKNRRILLAIITSAFVIINFIGGIPSDRAEAAEGSTGSVAVVLDKKIGDIVGIPGETAHVSIPVRAVGGTVYNPRISVDSAEMPFIVENITYKVGNYDPGNEPTYIPDFASTVIEFDLRVKETATIMNKSLTVKVEGTYRDEINDLDIPVSSIIPNINFVINTEKEPAQITVNDIVCKNALIGEDTSITFTLKNEGGISSHNTYFSIANADYDAAGIIPKYSKLKQEAAIDGELAPGEFAKVKLPISISPTATEGNKTLTINIEYKNADGTAFTSTCPIYVSVKANSEAPRVEIYSTKYASELTPGDEFNLVTTLRNIGLATARDIEVSVGNLGVESFIPNYTTDKIAAGNLKYDETVDVKIPLIVSKDAAKGLKEIPITITYKDDANVVLTTTSNLYLEVIKDDDDDSTISKPKLIISDFSMDSEELRAGSTFNLKFDIKNTHLKTAAKNIKVTIAQADNIFTVAEGSNSFYITKIMPGEVVENTLKMKVKADAVTKTYPVEITMEYEYDGAVANPTTGEIGETVKETLTLQAIENSRAVVNNVFVGSYDMPTVNQPTALTFEFYNMGKSPLNNVYATVEGDFTLSSGNMLYMGNFEAGASDYPEMEVIPNLEGQAKGNLIITFEDSNGDEVKLSKEFEATVQGEMLPPMTEETMGGDLGMINDMAKKPILPVGLFVIVQCGILIIVIPVTRKIILSLYRRKLRKEEEAN